MGGFDAYALQLHLDIGRPLLADDLLSSVQIALAEAAPGWSRRVHIAAFGRWTVRVGFDAQAPGSLEQAIRSVLRGGSNAPPTVGDRRPGTEALLRGVDRGVGVYLDLRESLLSTRPGDRKTDHVWIETTQKVVDGMPSDEWIRNVFESLCRHVQPRFGWASSLGERMARSRRYAGPEGSNEAQLHLQWLNFFGLRETAEIGLARMSGSLGVDVRPIGPGFEVILDPSGVSRRGARYWRSAEAAEAHIGLERLRMVIRRSMGLDRAPLPPQESLDDRETVQTPTVLRSPNDRARVRGLNYQKTRFASIDFGESGAIVEDFTFDRCVFDNVAIGPIRGVTNPMVVRRCTLRRCRHSVAILRSLIVEDCLIDGHSGGFWPVADVFLKHVVIRGNVDSIDIRSPRQLRNADLPDLPRVHDAFYAGVDWAVDIRDAAFKRCDLSGIPAHLVIRDPASQIVVTRQRALASRWRDVVGGTEWGVGIERLLETGEPAHVFVASKRGRDFEAQLDVFRRLREAGIAEPG